MADRQQAGRRAGRGALAGRRAGPGDGLWWRALRAGNRAGMERIQSTCNTTSPAGQVLGSAPRPSETSGLHGDPGLANPTRLSWSSHSSEDGGREWKAFAEIAASSPSCRRGHRADQQTPTCARVQAKWSRCSNDARPQRDRGVGRSSTANGEALASVFATVGAAGRSIAAMTLVARGARQSSQGGDRRHAARGAALPGGGKQKRATQAWCSTSDTRAAHWALTCTPWRSSTCVEGAVFCARRRGPARGQREERKTKGTGQTEEGIV